MIFTSIMTLSFPTSSRRPGFWLASRVLLSIFLIATLVGLLFTVPQWLVIKAEPVSSEAAVVLGGGGDGERLRRAIGLYDENLVAELILVGQHRGEWEHIIRRYCPECDLTNRRFTILVGSKNTFTDADLTLEHCRKKGIRSVLVVTDPYHTRRAGMTFNKIFRGSGISVAVVSSGDFGQRLAPNEHWWKDRRTLKTIWTEFGKILYMHILPVPSAR